MFCESREDRYTSPMAKAVTPATGKESAPGKVSQDGSDPLASELRIAVMRLARRLRQESTGQATQSQISALFSINKHGPLSLGELASIEKITPASVTRIVARLEEQGLVERRVGVTDRRVAVVNVSKTGRRLLSQIRTRRDAYVMEQLQELSVKERQTLEKSVGVLQRLAGNL